MKNRLLIVDDESVIRTLFLRVLEPLGYEVLSAQNVKMAKEMIQATSFDLLITDLSLGDGSGIEVIREFEAKQPQKPALIITGSLSAGDSKKLLKNYSHYECLIKPVEIEDLKSVVQRLLVSQTT